MTGVPMNVISTGEAPAGDRFDFWREVSSRTWVPYDLRCEPHLESRFQARIDISSFGPVQTTLMTTTPHSVLRTPALIRRDDPEVFKLSCNVRGRAMLAQDGRYADLDVGDLVLYDTSRPYLAGLVPEAPVSRLLILRFPRSALPLPDRDLRNLSAVRIPGDHGIGALSSQFLLRLARHMDELSPSDAARMSTLTLDLLTAALAHALEAHDAVPAPIRQRALTARIHAFISAHLGDADLTPATIAAAHHISVRYLHKLFREQDRTVAGWIRERRLERCRRDLAEPRLAARPINAIAARWGFTSPAHFSQTFRGAYGLSPRQFREQCATVPSD
ncbi:helix-turn-helix domain-containing protein [Spirillospora sp. CA-253888]